MTTLCIDAGTTVIKAVLFDRGGAAIGSARRETATLRPNWAWSEQSMPAVWDAVVDLVRELKAAAGAPIEALSITGQGDGAWLIDAEGEPTGPAILWNDGRAGAIVETWHKNGLIAEDFRVCGSRSFAGAPHAILAWLAQHDPERLRRSASLLSCTGWINFKLTGNRRIDASDAALPFLDLASGAARADVWERFGIGAAERLLPELVADEARAAPIDPRVAEQLGLAADVQIVLAPYDIGCMALGVGATDPGQACAILGTTICVQSVLGAPDLSGSPTGINIPLFDRFLRAFPTLAGCEVLDRMIALTGAGSVEDFEGLARQAAPGADGLLLLPYLSPAGERAPFYSVEACGVLHGLRTTHGRSEIARATFEALAFTVADCLAFAAQMPDAIMLCGGGARSDLWCQLIADTTGCTVRRSTEQEVGARGALVAAHAVLRGVNIGLAFAQMDVATEHFAPDNAGRAQGQARIERARRLRTLAAHDWTLSGDAAHG
ncbi:MAG TPA: FGGY family carbohydrate kinase [Sphingomonas sp.]|nr:FGGY family carbohydrate kinase [Sphingomonas sp.]